MKRALAVMFAGSLLAGLALADAGANDRFRMKTGRDLPSIEQTRRAASAAALERANFVSVVKPENPAHNDAEERFFMKNGRFTPQEEARLQWLRPDGELTEFRANPAHNDAEERFVMKNGRRIP